MRSSGSRHCGYTDLFFAQHEVHCPAASHVVAAGAAVCQEVGAGAAGLLQRVCQNWHVLKAALVVDGLGHGGDVGSAPEGVEGDGAKWVSENVTDQLALSGTFIRCWLAGTLSRYERCVEIADR